MAARPAGYVAPAQLEKVLCEACGLEIQLRNLPQHEKYSCPVKRTQGLAPSARPLRAAKAKAKGLAQFPVAALVVEQGGAHVENLDLAEILLGGGPQRPRQRPQES